jgi:hypothetical protein
MHHSIKKCLTTEEIQEFLDLGAQHPEFERLNLHTESCATCRRELASYKTLFQQLRDPRVAGVAPLAEAAPVAAILQKLPARRNGNDALPKKPGLTPLPPDNSWDFFWKLGTGLGFSCALVFMALILMNGQREGPLAPVVGPSAEVFSLSYVCLPSSDQILRESGKNGAALPPVGELTKGRDYVLVPSGKLVVRGFGNSVLEFEKEALFQTSPEGVILRAGRLKSEMNQLPRAYTVTGPYAQVVCLGTVFTVDVEAHQQRVLLEKGRIRIVSKKGEMIMEKPGIVTIRASGDITPVVALPLNGTKPASGLPPGNPTLPLPSGTGSAAESISTSF